MAAGEALDHDQRAADRGCTVGVVDPRGPAVAVLGLQRPGLVGDRRGGLRAERQGEVGQANVGAVLATDRNLRRAGARAVRDDQRRSHLHRPEPATVAGIEFDRIRRAHVAQHEVLGHQERDRVPAVGRLCEPPLVVQQPAREERLARLDWAVVLRHLVLEARDRDRQRAVGTERRRGCDHLEQRFHGARLARRP